MHYQSPATVYWALKGDSPRVSKETAERIRAVARHCGYHRAAPVYEIISGRTRLLSAIYPMSSPMYSEIAQGASDGAQAEGFLFFHFDGSTGERINRALCATLERRAEAILFMTQPEHIESEVVQQCREKGIAIVCVQPHEELRDCDMVAADLRWGMQEVVRHLASLGHRRIAYLGCRHHAALEWMFEGYRQGLKECGLESETCFVPCGFAGAADTRAAIRETLQRGERPTAIAAVTDHVAAAVMQEAAALGLRVPRDLSVTGFADYPMGELADQDSGKAMLRFGDYLQPRLTTVRQPSNEVGRLAAGVLLARVREKWNGEPAASRLARQEVFVRPQLIIRDSTAPAPVY